VGGTVAIVGGNVVFTPTASNGQPALLTIIDGNGSSTLTVNVAVTPVNDAPVKANTDMASTPINTLWLALRCLPTWTWTATR
jgi:hypothetical protein